MGLRIKGGLFVLLLTLWAGMSCKVKCQDPHLSVGYEGYDSLGLRSIIVKRFEKNGKFDQLLQTNYSGIAIDKPADYNFKDGDTIRFSVSETISAQYDYAFLLPLRQRTHRIYNIGFDQEKGGTTFLSKYDQCSNTVSYYLDGVMQTGKGISQRADAPGGVTILLKK